MKVFNTVEASHIPETAKTALMFALWACEKEGLEFSNGSTACYWNLLADLAKHVDHT